MKMNEWILGNSVVHVNLFVKLEVPFKPCQHSFCVRKLDIVLERHFQAKYGLPTNKDVRGFEKQSFKASSTISFKCPAISIAHGQTVNDFAA